MLRMGWGEPHWIWPNRQVFRQAFFGFNVASGEWIHWAWLNPFHSPTEPALLTSKKRQSPSSRMREAKADNLASTSGSLLAFHLETRRMISMLTGLSVACLGFAIMPPPNGIVVMLQPGGQLHALDVQKPPRIDQALAQSCRAPYLPRASGIWRVPA